MLTQALTAYAARIRSLRLAHQEISEPALAPAFQQLLIDCLRLLPAAPQLAVVPEFNNPGLGRPDIALKRPGEPARAFIELKHFTKAADPNRWTGAHDRSQFGRLQALACWATSNFVAIHLFSRSQELASADIVPQAALDPTTSEARALVLITSHNEQPLAVLLERLAQAQAPLAANARDLAANLAYASRLVRGIVEERLVQLRNANVEADPLQQVRAEFRDVLYAHPEAGGYSGASFDELFAGAFAQTLAFGLLLVREASGAAVDRHAAEHMPAEHPLMRTALQVLTLPAIVRDVGIGFDVMLDTVNSFAAELLVPRPGGGDPILYFYEDFLAVFDPDARERYGVYYTPVEVVRYMVGALDRALRENLGTGGLSDPRVALLDPAAGTGTFLLGIADRVRLLAAEIAGPGMVRPALTALAHRLYGFELLVGPYAVAHYRLHHALRGPSEPALPAPALPRLGVYLADTLSRPGADAPQGPLGFVADGIREERLEANRIKTEQPILAIIGNPPYRRLEAGENETLVGRWMDELWDDLKRPVREAGWGGELNTFPELSIAFWRWSIWKLFEADNAPQRGVIAFISNRKYLTGRPYAGLRRMLRERFDRIEIIDLRGDVRRGERAGIMRDEGVFNIMVGTAITLAIADGSRAGELAEVVYTDVWDVGLTTRSAKLSWLDEGAASGVRLGGAAIARAALDDMRPLPFDNGAWPSLSECFLFQRSGLQTKRDSLIYATVRAGLAGQIARFLASDDTTASQIFHDSRDRKWAAAKAHQFDAGRVILSSYRPLDLRFLYNHNAYGDFLRPALQEAWGASNICLYAMSFGTGEGPGVWCHGCYPDYHAFSGRGGYAFPCFDRRRGGDQINLAPALLAGLAGAYGTEISAQDAFDAILTLLSATSYTTLFAEDLEDTFPHIPFPGDHAVFRDAAALGSTIRAVETFERPPASNFLTPMLARLETTATEGPLGAVDWQEGEIILRADGSGRVSGIPREVWCFGVSGYRLLPHWFAARMGQPVDEPLLLGLRDVAGRIAELIDLFGRADHVLERALRDTLSRDSLGLGE